MRTTQRHAGRRARRTHLALGAALLLAGGGCRDTQPLRIGVVVSEDGVPGAHAAAEAVNAAGGIRGRRLELVVRPGDGTDANQAIDAAERLAADPTVFAVVGHANSAATLAASPVYNAHGLVQVSPLSTAPILSEAGPYTFRLVPSDILQAEFLGAQAVRLARARAAAIVYDNSDYGRALHLELGRDLSARGVRVVASIPYLARTGEPVRFIPQRLARQSPEVVFWLGGTTMLREFLGELRGVLPGVLVLGSDGVDAPRLYQDPAAFAGMHFVRFVDPASPDLCIARLRSRADVPAAITEAVLTYDAVLLLAGVLRAGPVSRDAVRQRLAAVGTTAPAEAGCAGTIRFDRAGDVERPYLLARVDSQGVHPAPGSH